MSTISAWLPRQLPTEQKATRGRLLAILNQRHEKGESGRFYRNVTSDETWLHHFHFQQQTFQCIEKTLKFSSTENKKFKIIASVYTVMATVFFNFVPHNPHCGNCVVIRQNASISSKLDYDDFELSNKSTYSEGGRASRQVTNRCSILLCCIMLIKRI
jgi:hypothetical protein